MGKRLTFYIVFIIAFTVACYAKVLQIKEQRAAKTVSVLSEWQEHGMPVEAYEVKKENLSVYTQVTALYSTPSQFLAYVPPTEALKIKVHQKALVTINEKVLPGTVKNLSTVANASTGLYQVVIQLDKETTLRPSSVPVQIELSKIKNVFTIPKRAVLYGENGAYVWKIENNLAQIQPVEVGTENFKNIVIKNGVSAGDKIIVRGIHKLEKGIKVSFLNQGSSK